MKKAFLLCVVAITAIGCASMSYQKLPPEELVIQEVYELEGMSQKELFEKSMTWMAKAFKSAQDVIQYQDKEAGKIIGKGFMVVGYLAGMPYDTYFTITLETKDNKARATIEDAYIQIVTQGKISTSPIDNEYAMKYFKPQALKLLKDYAASLESSTSDW